MERNRVKEFLTPIGYERFFGTQEERQVTGRISSLWLDQPVEFSMVKPTGESDREIREAVKTAVEQFLKSLNRQVTESHIAQLQQKIVELEKKNKELDDKLNSLNRLLLPFLEILEEERQIEEKLQKEMPELKFEKQDPFALKEGGWALPYEQLKELLEEE
jgi:vacuolar-type H+-ATPase subunit I/STV1